MFEVYDTIATILRKWETTLLEITSTPAVDQVDPQADTLRTSRSLWMEQAYLQGSHSVIPILGGICSESVLCNEVLQDLLPGRSVLRTHVEANGNPKERCQEASSVFSGSGNGLNSKP